MGDTVGGLAFWLAIGLLFVGITFGPIGKAIGAVVETVVGRLFGSDQQVAAALDLASQREAELRRVEERLLEVEERLDFAERLLTGGRPVQGPEADTPPEPVESVR